MKRFIPFILALLLLPKLLTAQPFLGGVPVITSMSPTTHYLFVILGSTTNAGYRLLNLSNALEVIQQLPKFGRTSNGVASGVFTVPQTLFLPTNSVLVNSNGDVRNTVAYFDANQRLQAMLSPQITDTELAQLDGILTSKTIQAQFADLYGSTNAINATVISLGTRSGNLEGATNGLNTAVAALIVRASNLEASTNGLHTAVLALATRTGNLEGGTNGLHTAVINLTTRANNLEAATGALHTVTLTLTTRANNLEGATGGLHTATINLATRATNLEGATGALNTATINLATRATNLENSTGGLHSAVLTLTTRANNLDTSTGALNTAVQTKQQGHARLTNLVNTGVITNITSASTNPTAFQKSLIRSAANGDVLMKTISITSTGAVAVITDEGTTNIALNIPVGGSGSTSTVVQAVDWLVVNKGIQQGNTNVGTNATVTLDYNGPRVANAWLYGPTMTFNFTNVPAVGSIGRVPFILRVHHVGIGGTVVIQNIGPKPIVWSSPLFVMSMSSNNLFYVDFDGTNFNGTVAQGDVTGGGAGVNSNAPSIFAPKIPSATASRAAVLGADGTLQAATGTPDGTKFLRDDNTYAVPPGSTGSTNFNAASFNGAEVSNRFVLKYVTPSRPAVIGPDGSVTNAGGTPTGTKFVRDDGQLAVPAGGGSSRGTTNILVTATNAVLLDLALYDRFNLLLLTNVHIRFTNADVAGVRANVIFQQDTNGQRQLVSWTVAGGVLQTNAGVTMQLTTNLNAMDLLEIVPSFFPTNLLAWWPKDFGPRIAATNAPGAGAPFVPGLTSTVFEETFEGTGYANGGWTEVLNLGLVDEDYASPALHGTESLRVQTAADNLTYNYHSFTAGSDRCLYFQFRPVSTPNTQPGYLVEIWNNGQSRIAAIRFEASGALTVVHGTTTATTAATTTDGTTYHVYFRYTAGTGANGTGSLSFSTDGTRNTSGSNYASVTTGTSTADAEYLTLGFIGFSGVDEFLFDRVQVGNGSSFP